jgi:hypothetical protein
MATDPSAVLEAARIAAGGEGKEASHPDGGGGGAEPGSVAEVPEPRV